MFEASERFLFFDYFRIPYRCAFDGRSPSGYQQLVAEASSRKLVWFAAGSDVAGVLPAAEHHVSGIPVFGSVVPDSTSGAWLRDLGHAWRPILEVNDVRGRAAASVWCDRSGSIFLPFDPGEVIRNYWSERYLVQARRSKGTQLKAVGRHVYYRVRPLMPRAVQIGLRRQLSRFQARARFPQWPIETALHDFYDFMFKIVTTVAESEVPWLAPWPSGRTWALVLSHDVETNVGYENIDILRRAEENAGYRSSWNLVPYRYDVEDAVVHELWNAGFEVGLHGLYHDGRDLESEATFSERLPEMREYASRWNAVGFRSPSTLRNWELLPQLGLEYDSSYPDTDVFEPQAGGCLSWLPFFNGDLVELPITLVQDHTLFAILRRDESVWLKKADFLRGRGGMALVITHPDYALDGQVLDAYSRLLETYKEDETAWKALPMEVSAWWRRRASSRIEKRRGQWIVVGPAAGEARISYTGGVSARPNVHSWPDADDARAVSTHEVACIDLS
jgi:hypothetical protein